MDDGLKNLDRFFVGHNKYLITTHESPDADGLGAEIAFLELLRHFGDDAFILNSDPLPAKYSFMDPDHEINVYTPDFVLPDDIGEYSLFVLDTHEFDNIGSIYGLLKDKLKKVFVIDHHEGGNDFIDDHYIRIDASSTCEIICRVIEHLGMEPSRKAARALYAGIVFDTGSFRYSKTTPVTFTTAGNLVRYGADPAEIYELMYEDKPMESILLLAEMLGSMEIYFERQLMLMYLTPAMLVSTGAPFTEGELNINVPLSLAGVKASVLIKQDIDGPLKVSMRTKGDLNVAEISLKYNGGGHKNAAGFKSKLSIEETKARILEDMKKFFE